MQISGMILSYSRSVCVYYCSMRLYKQTIRAFVWRSTRVCVYMNYKSVFLYECYKSAPIWYCHSFSHANHSSLFIRSFFIGLFFQLHVFVNCYSGNVICARGCITRNILYINRQINVWLRYTLLYFLWR